MHLSRCFETRGRFIRLVYIINSSLVCLYTRELRNELFAVNFKWCLHLYEETADFIIASCARVATELHHQGRPLFLHSKRLRRTTFKEWPRQFIGRNCYIRNPAKTSTRPFVNVSKVKSRALSDISLSDKKPKTEL